MKTLEERRLEKYGERIHIDFLVCKNSGDMVSEIITPEWVGVEDIKLCLITLLARLEDIDD